VCVSTYFEPFQLILHLWLWCQENRNRGRKVTDYKVVNKMCRMAPAFSTPLTPKSTDKVPLLPEVDRVEAYLSSGLRGIPAKSNKTPRQKARNKSVGTPASLLDWAAIDMLENRRENELGHMVPIVPECWFSSHRKKLEVMHAKARTNEVDFKTL
jgi:hypothetical protein